MKKIISFLLILIIVISFTACKKQQTAPVFYGEGILEHIDISKVARLEFVCPGESLSKATLKTVKTITSADEINDILGALSQTAYTEIEKLFDEGDYRIAEPTAYELRLYDSDDEYLCSLELKHILSDENTVIADNYRYKVADSTKIDALIEENIRLNCDCFICINDELISALDCETCTAARNGKFCTCEK